ncbi:MAG: cyclic nucleotide-binding domain-containing protein [Verrucomicrobiota bacterium]
MKTLDAVVAESPVFAGLDQKYLELIAGCAHNTGWEAGQYLFHEGDQADTFYLVRHGRVMLEVFVPGRGPLTVETIDEGGVVGWSWLFPPHRWHYDARALDVVRAVAFDGTCLRGKCNDDHTFGFHLLCRFTPIMVERLEATRLQLMDVYGRAA